MNKTAVFFLVLAVALGLSEAAGQPAPGADYGTSLAQALRKIAEKSYPSAIYNLKECIEVAPENPVPYYQLANVYATLQDGNQAVYYAKKAFSLAPENLWYQEYLLSLAVKYQKAESVQAVLEQRFETDGAQLGDLLNAYAYTRSWDKALAKIDSYEKRYGRDSLSLVARKDVYLKSGDYKNALKQLKVLQKTSPHDAHYAVERAVAMAGAGDTDGSWKYLEGFRHAHPDDGYVAYALLPHYRETGDVVRVFEALQCIVSDTVFGLQDKLKILNGVASLSAEDPRYRPQFEQALESVLAQAPDDPLACAYASDYYYGQDEQEKGFDLLRKAVRGGFGDREAVMRLLYAEAQQDDFEALARDAQSVLESIGEDPEVYFLYGYAAHTLGWHGKAAAALERGKQMAREGIVQLYVELCSLLGSVYNAMGDPVRSAENFEAVLAIDPDNAGVLNNYGYFTACRGENLPRARTMLERAVELMPEQAAFWDSYAWILYLQQDYPAALQAMERSLSLEDDPSVEELEHHWRILAALGDPRSEEARVRYLKSKAEESAAAPEHEPAEPNGEKQ